MEKKEFSVKEIAEHIRGEIINPDDSIRITSMNSPGKGDKNTISVVLGKKNAKPAVDSPAPVIVTDKEVKDCRKTIIMVKDSFVAFNQIMELFKPFSPPFSGIHETCVKGKNVSIAKDAKIGAHVVIGDDVEIGSGSVIFPNTTIGSKCKIGNSCIIYSNVAIYENVSIGNNVIIHSGVVIGGDGFGFYQRGKIHNKILQKGGVIIHDDVEIGSGCTIDRATLDNTVIGKGTKFDNLCHVAHNVSIGENVIIVAQVGIAGSSTIGNNCILAGQAGIADHVTLADNVILGARAATKDNIDKPGIYLGAPCRTFVEETAIWHAQPHLPDLIKRVKRIEEELNLPPITKKGKK